MFKKFTAEENISSTSQIKNSAQRTILTQIVESYPSLEDAIEYILPKKSMLIAKARLNDSDNVQLITVNNEVMFYNVGKGPFFPTLKLLHKYPSMMKRMQVDRGAIKFILGGANIMCPGFTSKGGSLPCEMGAELPVAIYAEGKEHAIAVGMTKMSTKDIVSVNKGIAVETVHFLLDGLYTLQI